LPVGYPTVSYSWVIPPFDLGEYTLIFL